MTSREDPYPAEGPKYEVTDIALIHNGKTLFRIRALRDFGNVVAGILGGYISGEHNLSHHGTCWIGDDARVYGEAVVSDSARVFGRAAVYDRARVSDHAQVLGNAEVSEDARVYKRGIVSDNAVVRGRGQVRDDALVFGNAVVCDRARVLDHGQLGSGMRIGGETVVREPGPSDRRNEAAHRPRRTRHPRGRPPRLRP